MIITCAVERETLELTNVSQPHCVFFALKSVTEYTTNESELGEALDQTSFPILDVHRGSDTWNQKLAASRSECALVDVWREDI